MNATSFLTALWGDTPPGLIQLWTLHDKTTRYLAAPADAGNLDLQPDVYVAVATTREPRGPHTRARADQTCAIAGLWIDLDVNGGPNDKTGAAPDQQAALELAGRIAEPTLLVDSGYGIHGWWLFEEPWIFRSVEERQQAALASAQWYDLHRRHVSWTIDGTHDLARLLRIPGTVNAKNPADPRPVRLLAHGDRHRREDLLAIAAAAGDDLLATSNVWELRDAPQPADPAAIRALCDRDILFAQTWRHDRPEHPQWSMSEFDLALCSIARRHGWDADQLAGLIVAHRQQHGDPKGRRTKYVADTVARAIKDTPPTTSAAAAAVTPDSVTPSGTYTADQWAEHLLDRLQADDDGAMALPWPELTEALDGGIRPGEVCLIGGWTSHGKSIVVDQIADHAAENGSRVHLYLTEMTAYQRGLRLLARHGAAPFKALKRRDLTTDQWRRVLEALKQMPYGCSIVSDWGVNQVVADIRRNRWDLAVVDLIHGFDYADERDLSRTSSALMRAAKGSSVEHRGTAILSVAHLNDGQMRDQRALQRPRPGMHSLKGSSSLKQDSDIVMFVWQEDDELGRPTGDGVLWAAKSRDGALNDASVQVTLDPVRLRFDSDSEWMQAKTTAGAGSWMEATTQ